MSTQPTSPRVVVVGAGTAGSIVASTLSENSGLHVTLVEAGVDRVRELPFNLYEAFDDPSSRWPALPYTRERTTTTYDRGRGVGGSSEVNGCMASVPSFEDISPWENATDDAYWSWSAWKPALDRVSTATSTVEESLWGRADTAMLNAIRHDPRSHWRAARFAVNEHDRSRNNYGFTQLASSRSRPNLHVETNVEVEGLLVESGSLAEPRVLGVRLRGGREIVGDHVVLSAGAVGSPALLLRSGLGRPGTGRNLQNHLGVSFTWRFATSEPSHPFAEPGKLSSPVSCVVADVDGPCSGSTIQLLPLNAVGSGPSLRHYGGLISCPLAAVSSRGRIRVSQNGEVAIDHPINRSDLDLLRDAARVGADVALAAVRNGDAEAAFSDATGTPVEAVSAMSDTELESWVITHLAPIYHAVGTCRMGRSDDRDSVVDPFCAVLGVKGVSVIDASALPTLPAAGPHVTVAAFALHAASRLSTQLFGNRGRS